MFCPLDILDDRKVSIFFFENVSLGVYSLVQASVDRIQKPSVQKGFFLSFLRIILLQQTNVQLNFVSVIRLCLPVSDPAKYFMFRFPEFLAK